MSDDAAQELDPLDGRPQVRIFTLADYVAEESSGKLYISGAGLEWTGVEARADPAGAGYLLSFQLVIRLAFPRAIARDSHAVEVRVLDRAGSPAGPDPLLTAAMRFDLNRAPKDFTEVSGSLPVQVMDYPTNVEPNDVICLHLLVDDIVVSRLPVQLRPADV